MADYLLDSTVLIDVARGQQGVSDWLVDNLARGSGMYVSAVTVTEYISGVPEAKRETALIQLRAYPLRDIDVEIAAEAGAYRHAQARQGYAVSVPDALQAALVQHHQMVLATSNAAHFRGIKVFDPRAP